MVWSLRFGVHRLFLHYFILFSSFCYYVYYLFIWLFPFCPFSLLMYDSLPFLFSFLLFILFYYFATPYVISCGRHTGIYLQVLVLYGQINLGVVPKFWRPLFFCHSILFLSLVTIYLFVYYSCTSLCFFSFFLFFLHLHLFLFLPSLVLCPSGISIDCFY